MTLKVVLVLVLGIVAVFGLPRPRRHHDHDRDYEYGHHDHHHGHVEYDHRHDVHHGGHHYDGHHHSDHHGGFQPHHGHRFRRAASHGGGFDAGFDSPYESFGEHGNYQGYQVHKHNRPIHGHKKTGFSSSSAIAQSINTPYGTTHTISKTHAHSGTIGTFGKKR